MKNAIVSRVLTVAAVVAAAGLVLLGAAAAQATPLNTGHYKPKWTQLPDMVDGNDTLSMHRTNGPVVADDFRSDGRPIVGLHWWGSYFQDTGQGAERFVSFEISIHVDCPANATGCNNGGPYPYSTPSNNPTYFSDILSVEEDFYGTTADGIDIYEYWVLVDPLDSPDFFDGWNEVAGQIYWLDVAWNAGQLGTAIGDDVWGWAKAAGGCTLDCAVQTNPPSPGGNPHLGPWNVLTNDMAFEIITVPEPASLALFGVGLAGLGVLRRRRKA